MKMDEPKQTQRASLKDLNTETKPEFCIPYHLSISQAAFGAPLFLLRRDDVSNFFKHKIIVTKSN